MILLKDDCPTPRTLESKEVEQLRTELARRVSEGVKLKKEDFKPYWRERDVKDTLVGMHRGKCCYCERKRESFRESDVEHFRPKGGVTEKDDHPGYWWLAYEWSNYLFSCKRCNEDRKKMHFPLLDESVRAYSQSDNLASENPVLVNPRVEDPQELIAYDCTEAYGMLAKPLGKDAGGRGTQVIKLFELDRFDLNRARGGLVEGLQELATTLLYLKRSGNKEAIEEAGAKVKRATASELQYAGFRRHFFTAQGLQAYVAND